MYGVSLEVCPPPLQLSHNSTMSPPLKPIDRQRIEQQEEIRVELVVGPSPGLFTKLLGGATALLLLALAFVFSVLVFSVLAVGLLGVLLRLAWVRRKAARARRS